MKKVIALSLLFLSFISFQAQNDAKAMNLLNQVSASYNKPTQMSFDFELKNSQENISQKESGNVYISGDRYNMSLMSNTQVYDGRKVYNISSEDKEVTITNNPSKEDLLTPTKVLNSYKKGYQVKMAGSKKINGRNATLINLIPTDKASATTKIVIGIDSVKKDLLQIMEYNKQGSVTTITINKSKKGISIPKAFFTFKESYYKGKGYYITVL